MTKPRPLQGAGLGLRRQFLGQPWPEPPLEVAFWEVAPENWIGVGGAWGKSFRKLTERRTLVAHGLSLSIGGPLPLDWEFLRRLKGFLQEHQVHCYSEHLSYCSDQGQLYDLMPIPFTGEAARYVASRVRQVQDLLGQRIALENISYYAAPGQRMEEVEFINAVIDEADCDLLLDLNNIYVNSCNHGYNAEAFLRALPLERVRYAHIAGHTVAEDNLRIDTHGSEVIGPVWQLLEQAYQLLGPFPTLLERDFNIPPLDQLLREVRRIDDHQRRWTGTDDGQRAIA